MTADLFADPVGVVAEPGGPPPDPAVGRLPTSRVCGADLVRPEVVDRG